MKWLLWLGTMACTGMIVCRASLCAAGELKVVVTLKPIHSLVAAVMAGIGEPRLLIDGARSEHTYALKPSDARALNEADVVFRVSAGLEVFMTKVLRALPSTVRVVTLDEAPGLVSYPRRTGGTFDDDEPADALGGAHHGDTGHSHDATAGGPARDGHIWLDPINAKVIAAHVAAVLAAEIPEHAARLRSNATALAARLDALSAELEAELRPLQQSRYVVFHDAYQYLERRYGLNPVGSVTISPDLAVSAKRLNELRWKVRSLKATCIFAEPEFEPKLVETVREGTSARSGTLDPLGAAIPAGADLYFVLMKSLAADLKSCLDG